MNIYPTQAELIGKFNEQSYRFQSNPHFPTSQTWLGQSKGQNNSGLRAYEALFSRRGGQRGIPVSGQLRRVKTNVEPSSGGVWPNIGLTILIVIASASSDVFRYTGLWYCLS